MQAANGPTIVATLSERQRLTGSDLTRGTRCALAQSGPNSLASFCRLAVAASRMLYTYVQAGTQGLLGPGVAVSQAKERAGNSTATPFKQGDLPHKPRRVEAQLLDCKAIISQQAPGTFRGHKQLPAVEGQRCKAMVQQAAAC